MSDTHKCPACGGDGINTCNNPDHGFMSIGFDAHGCPCCGNDPNHKVSKYRDGKTVYLPCEYCKGTGKLSKEECVKILHEWQIYEPIEDYEL